MKTAPTALERRSTRPNRPNRPHQPEQPGQPDGQPISQPDGPPESPETETATAETRERRRYKEVWLVEDRREGKSIWTRVGVAFENTDGSWNIRLSALPVGGGRLNMRDPVERTEREAHGTQQRVAA
jgi:hypothetical protein